MNLYDYSIEKVESNKTKVSIKLNQKQFYYIYDSMYDEYLTQTYDCFVLGILIKAMFSNKSIYVEGPMSERLYNNLSKILIPMLHFCYKELHPIQIFPNTLVADHYDSNKTGFGLSCGIDSLCCLEDLYYKEKREELKLNIACNFHSGGSDNIEQYRLRLEHVSNFLRDNTKLQMLSIESNINDFNVEGFTHEKIHGIKTISFVYLFQKLFKRFYISSGMTFNEFKLVQNPVSFGWIEGFVIPLLSTESTEICLHGCNYTRLYKTYLISKNSIYDNYIDVCINTSKQSQYRNCGGCFKCIRTLLTLECYTDLKRYRNIFDLMKYAKEKNGYIRGLKPDKYVLDSQLLQLLKMKNKI